jgi:hypothetical protein
MSDLCLPSEVTLSPATDSSTRGSSSRGRGGEEECGKGKSNTFALIAYADSERRVIRPARAVFKCLVHRIPSA